MALIICSECGKEISDLAETCPNCGIKLKQKQKKSKKRLIPLLLVIFILVIGTIYILYNQKMENDLKNQEVSDLLRNISDKLNQGSSNSLYASKIVHTVWSQANSRDINRVLEIMYSGDIKNKEMSGLGMLKDGFAELSWNGIYKEMNNFSDTINKLKTEKTDIDKLFDETTNVDKSKYEKEMGLILDYYILYEKIYNSAISPSGNLLNYSSDLKEMENEYKAFVIKAKTIFE